MEYARTLALLAAITAAFLSTACSTKEGGEIQPPTYTVTYDANGASGGTVPVDTARYRSGQTVTVPANTGGLVKTRCLFAGWCLTADGTGTVYLPGQTFPMGTRNLTLYVKWAPTYGISYDGNGNSGGSAPVDETQYLEGAEVPVLGNSGGLVKVVEGVEQVFSGWNTRADGAGASYAAGSTLTMGAADVLLYAVWLPPYVLPVEAFDVSLGARSALVDGTRAYLVAGTAFKVLDITDPLNPATLGTVTHGYTDLRVEAHVVSSGVVWCIRSSSGGMGEATHIFGVDVSDPANPVPRGTLTLQASSSLLAESSLLHAGHWLVHDYSRNLIYVIDIADPDAPVVTGSWAVPDMVNGGPGLMMIEGDLLYLPCGEDRTLRIYDLTSLGAVVERGVVGLADEAYGTAVKIGTLVYLTTRSNLSVVDVTDPASPVVVGTGVLTGYLKARKGRLFSFGFPSPIVKAYSLADPVHPVIESSSTLAIPAPSTALWFAPLAYPAAAWVGDYLLGLTYGSAEGYHGLRAMRFVVN